METITSAVGWLNGIVWGVPMLVLILGVGLFLTLGLKLLTILKIPFGFRLLWEGRIPGGEGEITPFNALMTSLAATIGTGNIAGVATAIFLGGPGAVFWMWMTALVGMATKYAEAVLAVRYREEDERGKHVGGPMYYIKNGLGKKWRWMAVCFALFAGIAGFGIGNMVQANSIANALNANFAVPEWLTGVVLVVLVGAVLLGGIERIATVAGKLVPLMAIGYISAGTLVLLINAAEIPAAFGLILKHAFTPTAATGGFAGAAVWAAIRFGVARGVFSNEAGLGSAPIAHAAAQTHGPHRAGDHPQRRMDQWRDGRGSDLQGVRSGAAGSWWIFDRGGFGRFRLHDHPRLELLLRAFAGISVRHQDNHALPGAMVTGRAGRRHLEARLRVASGRYAERDDGHPEPDRAGPAQPDCVQAHQGILRYQG